MIELSENECLTIVKKATKRENVEIQNFSGEHFGDFLGYLGEYYRLRILASVDGDCKDLQFFVKSLPIVDMRGRRQMLIETGIFRKELEIYKNLLQKLIEIDEDGASWCPNVYLVRSDLIVFNDLTLQDYKILPFNTFDMHKEHVKAILRSLANFHACSILYEKNENISIGQKFRDILFETSIMNDSWFTAGLDVVKRVAENDFKIEDSQILYKKIYNVIDIMENSPYNVPKVLCHRDLWKNNLMFHENPLNCILIDFQTCRYLSLSVDVTLAVISTTSRQHYEDLMDYYMLYYYQELENKLAKFAVDLGPLMSYKEFSDSCNYHKKVALVYKTIVISLTQVPRELFNNFTTDDYEEFAHRDRYSILRKFMERDESFKRRLLDAVDAVINNFSYPK